MIRVMIVEDDVLFRKSIRSMLDWENLGFVICGECMHGRDALNRMDDYAPDIVFTDISMPQMNGIDLIRALKRDYPSVRIIVLSSYDDFDFVKVAMKLGADDYILKHELDRSMDQFLLVLEECKAKITDSSSDRLFGKADERQMILDAFMNGILNGRIKGEAEIEQHLRRLIVYFKFDRYMTAVILSRKSLSIADVETEQPSDWPGAEADLGRFREAVLGLGESPASAQQLMFMVDDCTGVCLFNVKGMFSQKRIHDTVSAELNGLFDSGLELCIGVSALVEGVSDLSRSYDEAFGAMEQSFLYAGQTLMFHSELSDRPLPKEIALHGEQLTAVLEHEDEQEASAWADKLGALVYHFRLAAGPLKQLCDALNGQVVRWAEQKGVKMDSITRHGHIWTAALAKSESREVFVAYLRGCLQRALTWNKLMPQTSHPRVRQAVDYIGQHYSKPIGLREVAQELNMSENYLSNVFKQETGMRFVEYLNEVRLHHAKRLVANANLKVYQVAEQCGFHSTAYFCRLFKEKTGMSLTTHRKKEWRS